jgi:ABC-type nitrate/sulfonate/bicarbonate transport system substrate-binding protein
MNKVKFTLFRYVALLILAGTFFQGCNSCNSKSDKDFEELTLADASVVWWMGPGTIAQKDSIYVKNGLNVKTFSMQTGLESKNAVVSGAADIGLTATTPLAMGAFNKENLIVLGSYMVSNNLLSLLTQKSDDTTLYSKPTPPIAIVKGTISELYFYNYMSIHFQDIDISTLNQLNVKPADAINAVKGGGAKSVVIWEPFATMLSEQVPDLKINRAEDCYTHRMYIVTTPEILAKKRSAIERFVKSFKQACDLLNENPVKGKEILKSIFPQQESSMNALWNKVDFSLKFDYETMKELILKDAEITYKLGQTPKDKAGNCRRLQFSDIEHYFKHDFKLQ